MHLVGGNLRETGATQNSLRTRRTGEIELGAGKKLLQRDSMKFGACSLLLLVLLCRLQLLHEQRLLQQAHQVLALRLYAL